MSAGGDELVWRAVSDMRCQFGGDNLGVAVEERDGRDGAKCERQDTTSRIRENKMA